LLQKPYPVKLSLMSAPHSLKGHTRAALSIANEKKVLRVEFILIVNHEVMSITTDIHDNTGLEKGFKLSLCANCRGDCAPNSLDAELAYGFAGTSWVRNSLVLPRREQGYQPRDKRNSNRHDVLAHLNILG
jgi:hypothetical protein